MTVIWINQVDKHYETKVTATKDPGKGILTVHDGQLCILSTEVDIAYQAKFGPDAQDVNNWCSLAIAAVDKHVADKAAGQGTELEVLPELTGEGELVQEPAEEPRYLYVDLKNTATFFQKEKVKGSIVARVPRDQSFEEFLGPIKSAPMEQIQQDRDLIIVRSKYVFIRRTAGDGDEFFTLRNRKKITAGDDYFLSFNGIGGPIEAMAAPEEGADVVSESTFATSLAVGMLGYVQKATTLSDSKGNYFSLYPDDKESPVEFVRNSTFVYSEISDSKYLDLVRVFAVPEDWSISLANGSLIDEAVVVGWLSRIASMHYIATLRDRVILNAINTSFDPVLDKYTDPGIDS